MEVPQITVGNTASLAKDQKRYNWVLYVRGATEFVQSVTIKLHPTFKNPVRTCEEAPFEFSSRGWGAFDIDVLIKWKGGQVLRTTWELQFDHPDVNRAVPVPPDILSAHAAADAIKAAAAAQAATPAAEENQVDDLKAYSDLLGERGGGMESEYEDSPEVEEGLLDIDASCEVAELAPEPPVLLRSVSSGSDDEDSLRTSICTKLRDTPFLAHDHPSFMHGRGYDGPMKQPKVLWRSTKPPRKDHDCPKWLTATEFEDVPDVTASKIRQLATLIRSSRKTVVYTGAGISASVIGQAAASGTNSVGWKDNLRGAPPTFTHHALGFLGREGLIHSWVQQNHDGLPQKAGFPQERINEIHGSWYDPSNPVVKYSGSLHARAYPWMRDDAQTADLVLVLGTSLGGLNADQVATSTAERSLLLPAPPFGVLSPGAWLRVAPRSHTVHRALVTAVHSDTIEVRCKYVSEDNEDSDEEDDRLEDPITLPKTHPMELVPAAGGGLGTVCMNLQQTPQDGKMTLRFFGKSDGILTQLIQELGFNPQIVKAPAWPKASRALVPYGPDGQRLVDLKGRRMWLDLRKGQEVRITPGHNIQGAKQPQYMHIGAKKAISVKGETRQPGVGLGVVGIRSTDTCSFLLNIEGVQMRLGIWWLESAIRGGVEALPIVNTNPVFEDQ